MNEQAACWRRWEQAVGDEAVDQALRRMYARLDAAVAERPGVCELSGRCCRFDSFGHRLYVTGLEVAWLVGQIDAEHRGMLREADLPTGAVGRPMAGGMDGCPFQQQGLCSVHAIRPLGCRIFFCDPAAETWQNDVYEQFLNELRDMHERFDLPYRYMEWRAALAEARAVLGSGDG